MYDRSDIGCRGYVVRNLVRREGSRRIRRERGRGLGGGGLLG